MSTDYDVIVVGGGISGLRTADLLAKHGVSILLLEAKDRVGGRTCSITVNHGANERTIDLGGQWVAPSQVRMNRLLEELGIGLVKQYDHGKKVFDPGHGPVRIHDPDSTDNSTHGSALQMDMKVIEQLNRMARTIPVDNPAACPDAVAWDAMTMDTWMDIHGGGIEAKQTMRGAVAMLLGCELSQTSVLHWCWYIAVAGGFEQLADTRDAGQDSFVKGGAQQISKKLAARICAQSARNKVLLSTPVQVVQVYDGASRVRVTALDGAHFSAKRLVFAIPPNQMGWIHFESPLHPERGYIHQRASMGCYAKCLVLFDRPFWRDIGLSGEVFRLAPTPEMPVVEMYDAAYEDGSLAAMVAFVPGNLSVGFAARAHDDRRDLIIRVMERCLGTKAREYLAYYDKCWTEDPYTGGCPVGNYAVGTFSVAAATLRKPHGPIFFAGTETATVWSGYMEGAVESAERAAAEVLASLNR